MVHCHTCQERFKFRAKVLQVLMIFWLDNDSIEFDDEDRQVAGPIHSDS
jgi:hypothetical protein